MDLLVQTQSLLQCPRRLKNDSAQLCAGILPSVRRETPNKTRTDLAIERQGISRTPQKITPHGLCLLVAKEICSNEWPIRHYCCPKSLFRSNQLHVQNTNNGARNIWFVSESRQQLYENSVNTVKRAAGPSLTHIVVSACKLFLKSVKIFP